MEPEITNVAGGLAYQESARLELLGLLLTSHVDTQAYRSRADFIQRMRVIVEKFQDKEFAAKAAVLARTQFGQRSTSHLVAALLAKTVKGSSWLGKFLQDVVYRLDDITEILAAYSEVFGPRPLPNMFKQRRGLAGAFDKFDYYHFAKYQENQRAIKMVDAVNLLHPKPTDKNRKALKDLINGTLEPPETWEVLLTQAGNNAKSKAAAWEKLVSEGKLGYMALLMNLRNISSQAPGILSKALDQLCDPVLIKKSLVLPYRYFRAFETLAKGNATGKTLAAIEAAAEISLCNVPSLPGNSLVALDVSGSMNGKPLDTGMMFASVIAKANQADLLVFGGNATFIQIKPTDSLFVIVKKIMAAPVNRGSTDFNSIFRTAKKSYDRIVVLSDMQGYADGGAPTRTFKEWKKRVGVNPKVWSFHLCDYGSLMFPEKDIFCVAGWSDKVLNIMTTLEQDRNALLNLTESVELKGVNG